MLDSFPWGWGWGESLAERGLSVLTVSFTFWLTFLLLSLGHFWGHLGSREPEIREGRDSSACNHGHFTIQSVSQLGLSVAFWKGHGFGNYRTAFKFWLCHLPPQWLRTAWDCDLLTTLLLPEALFFWLINLSCRLLRSLFGRLRPFYLEVSCWGCLRFNPKPTSSPSQLTLSGQCTHMHCLTFHMISSPSSIAQTYLLPWLLCCWNLTALLHLYLNISKNLNTIYPRWNSGSSTLIRSTFQRGTSHLCT